MKFNFQELFPLIRYGTKDEFEGHCRFYFPDDPSECLAFVDRTITQIESDNAFAWDACTVDGKRPTASCCKEYAKDNDVAYNVCMDRLATSKASDRASMQPFSIRNIVLFVVILVLLGYMIRLIVVR